MGISKKELLGIMTINLDIEKNSKLSFDGKNLLTRIPKEIENTLGLKKGNKISWKIQNKNKIIIEVLI